jgi:hypothetical protein
VLAGKFSSNSMSQLQVLARPMVVRGEMRGEMR